MYIVISKFYSFKNKPYRLSYSRKVKPSILSTTHLFTKTVTGIPIFLAYAIYASVCSDSILVFLNLLVFHDRLVHVWAICLDPQRASPFPMINGKCGHVSVVTILKLCHKIIRRKTILCVSSYGFTPTIRIYSCFLSRRIKRKQKRKRKLFFPPRKYVFILSFVTGSNRG